MKQESVEENYYTNLMINLTTWKGKYRSTKY